MNDTCPVCNADSHDAWYPFCEDCGEDHYNSKNRKVRITEDHIADEKTLGNY